MSVALIIQHAMHMCHIVICGLSSPSSFFHIISQASWFKKQHFWTKMCVSIFSTNVWSIFHSKKNWQRYDQTNILVCMNSASCCFDIVMEIEFTWQFFFKKSSYILWNSIKWEQNRSMQMDRHDECISRFSVFCECA